MDVISYLHRKQFQFRRRGEEGIMNCPFCEDTERKFSINLITGLWQCFHHNRCGLSGNFYDFQKKNGDNPEKQSSSAVPVIGKKKKYVIPSQTIAELQCENVLSFLTNTRKLSQETLSYFKIGSKNDIVVFPFFKNGVRVNSKYRHIQKKEVMYSEKDAELCLFNRDNVQSQTLIITEGEYDCMALHEYGIDSVSVPNGCMSLEWVENEWDYLSSFDKIKICFDSDQAGKEGATRLAKRIGIWKCSIIEFPCKDANDCLVKGVPKEKIIECLENGKEISPETIMCPSEFSSKIFTLFERGDRLFGDPTVFDGLDFLLKGWRGGEVTIWTGKSGAGKSTILNQHFLDAAMKGRKTCIYSGEMPPDRYLRWAVMQHLGEANPSREIVNGTLEWMDGRIYILNICQTIDVDLLLSDFEYAARRYDCKHFIIDSFMKVKKPSGGDKDEYSFQEKFMSDLCDFAKTFSVHVHLVAHPRKTQTDRDEPGKVDVKGNSHITDLADNVIVMYRVGDEMKDRFEKKKRPAADAILLVKKNREYGFEGSVYLKFDSTTKKFYEVE